MFARRLMPATLLGLVASVSRAPRPGLKLQGNDLELETSGPHGADGTSFAEVGAAEVGETGACAYESLYPRQYVSYKTDALSPQSLDGDLTKSVWTEVAWTSDFVDIATSTTPKFKTRAKMRWDDTYLYVAAELEEPNIWANLTEDDEVIYKDNDFEVFVDPSGSTHYYKEFEMNALNKSWDLCLNKAYADGGYENSSRVFNESGWGFKGLRSAVKIFPQPALNNPSITGKGWTVEVAFPLADLIYNNTETLPQSGSMWRIDFSRVEWGVKVVDGKYWKASSCQSCAEPGTAAEDNWVWSPQGEVAMHLPERWGILQFAEGPVNATEVARYDQWPSRAAAVALYYAQKAYAENNSGAFTENFEALKAYSAGPFEVCTEAAPTLKVIVGRYGQQDFSATVQSPASPEWAATISSDRYLTVARSTGATSGARSHCAAVPVLLLSAPSLAVLGLLL